MSTDPDWSEVTFPYLLIMIGPANLCGLMSVDLTLHSIQKHHLIVSFGGVLCKTVLIYQDLTSAIVQKFL